MGIEWIVFGTVWAVMAGFSIGDYVAYGRNAGGETSLADLLAVALLSVTCAPLLFGLAARHLFK